MCVARLDYVFVFVFSEGLIFGFPGVKRLYRYDAKLNGAVKFARSPVGP